MTRPWTVLALAFLSQNLAIGITFGSYGLAVGDIAAEFGAGRSLASLGIALAMLTMGLMSPLLGHLLDRWSIRGMMMIGAAAAAAGFQLASHAASMPQFLLCYGIVVGFGITAMGVLPASKLAANWFPQSTGKAIGFVSLPVLIAVGPPLFGMVIAEAGWRELFRLFSYAYLALLPFLLLIRDRPPQSRALRQDEPLATEAPVIRWRDSLADRRLWLMVLIAGIMFSGGIVLITHIVQHALGQGIELARASLLLSVNGVAAVCGAMLFGWLCDRLSPLAAVTVNIALQAIMWPYLLFQGELIGLVVGTAVLGLCGGGAHPALSALVGAVFGARRFGTILGQITLLVIPFNFGAAPLAGLLYDIGGSYTIAFLLQAGLCLLGVLLLVAAGSRVVGLQAAPAPPRSA